MNEKKSLREKLVVPSGLLVSKKVQKLLEGVGYILDYMALFKTF